MKHVKKFEDEKVNEHHAKDTDEKLEYVIDNVDRLEDGDINYIYQYVEDRLGKPEPEEKHNLR
jgi:hypothetical protein